MSEADLVFPPVNNTHSGATERGICNADALAESKLPMNMELTRRENYLAGDLATSSRVEGIANLLSTPVDIEKEENVAVIQALRSTNSKLFKQAMQLEQALVECTKDWKTQHERSQVIQTQLAQKTHELETAQEQIKLLKQEQQTNKQITQQQQILIEGLTVQLQASQERVNQLEREWLFTQATHNEQTYQLRQTESTCQELRNRLTRQQRYTMQLKVALEKCLDQPSPKSETAADSDRIFTYTATHEENTDAPHQVIFAQVQPIPPWSGNESKPDAVFTAHSLDAVTEATATTEIDENLVEAFMEQFPAAIETLGETPEEQHDAVLNLLSDSSNADAGLAQNPVELVAVTDTSSRYDTATADQSQGWLEATFAEVLESSDATELNIDRAPESPSVPSEESVTEFEFDQLPAWEETYFANPNWPSPVVYPSRSSKKRKTLAAIELPNFAHSS